MKVLIAEDDASIRKGLAEIMEAEGYEVIEAVDGEQALTLYEQRQPALVCLDIMMPRVNGYDVCKRIRERDATVPIIFISAKSEEIDKVIGLELGADDFIVKPFGVKEVVARIRAVTRRYLASRKPAAPGAQDHFMMKDLEVFPAQLRARRDGCTIELSLREVKLLTLFHERKGEVLDRNVIYNQCWGMDHYPNTRTLDQHISQLRKRIERDPRSPELIQTVHGTGYRYG